MSVCRSPRGGGTPSAMKRNRLGLSTTQRHLRGLDCAVEGILEGVIRASHLRDILQVVKP